MVDILIFQCIFWYKNVFKNHICTFILIHSYFEFTLGFNVIGESVRYFFGKNEFLNLNFWS